MGNISKNMGLVRVHGVDAVPFLQGQLSNDMSLLKADRPLLAGYHNPQGRVIAVLWLLQPAPDEIVALLPTELTTPVAARLSRFVLRSKVKVSAESTPAPQITALLDAVHTANAGTRPLPASNDQRLANIAAGLPQVYPATCEAFVAQMLNLDVVGGISFEKGCYTGQEVIARAHYRGRVKRRMQRFLTDGPAALAPGDTGTLADGRAFKVVEAARHADGRCEFLAVAPLVPGATAEADPDTYVGADTSVNIEAGADDPSTPARTPLAVQSLPLPYSLPD